MNWQLKLEEVEMGLKSNLASIMKGSKESGIAMVNQAI